MTKHRDRPVSDAAQRDLDLAAELNRAVATASRHRASIVAERRKVLDRLHDEHGLNYVQIARALGRHVSGIRPEKAS
jgi:hypothetical protein